jgi:hypothetical protein
VEQLVVVQTGYVKIDESIVIVVAGRNPHGISNTLQSGLLSHIGESTVAVVAE